MVIIGGGIVGLNAAKVALGLGASVTILETSLERMRFLDNIFPRRGHHAGEQPSQPAAATARADVLVGAVLIPGYSAPKLVTRDMLAEMKPGSVVVDVAVDQGGCFETTRPTTHSDPVYEVDGVVHYCVANMPGAVPRTSTFALNNATLPFTRALADQGIEARRRPIDGLCRLQHLRRPHHLRARRRIARSRSPRVAPAFLNGSASESRLRALSREGAIALTPVLTDP